MKRPFCTVGFTFLLWLTVLTYIGNSALTLALAIGAFLIFIISLLIKKSRRSLLLPAVSLSVCVSSLLFFFAEKDYSSVRDLVGGDYQIIAAVKEEPQYRTEYKRYYCKAEIISISGKSYKGNMRLSFSTEYEDNDLSNFTIGNVLSFDGRLYEAGKDNKDIADYFRTEKIYVGASRIKNLTVIRQGTKPISALGNALRNKISASLSKYFSRDAAGLLTALVTGNKEQLSDEIYGDFRLIGIAHLMAVSGMHLTILTMAAELLLKRLRRKRLKSAILSAFTVFVMLLADFSPSVIRAGTMRLMHLKADSAHMKADPLNSLGLALTLILACNPFACKSTGLLLSVLSTLSIITVSLPLSELISTRLGDLLRIKSIRLFSVHKAIVFSLITSFSIMVFTVPVLADSFGNFSLISPIANLVFLPIAPILITSAAISALLCSLGIMPHFLAEIIEGFTELCIKAAHLIAQTGGFNLEVKTETGVLICFITCLGIIGAGMVVRWIYIKRRYGNVGFHLVYLF